MTPPPIFFNPSPKAARSTARNSPPPPTHIRRYCRPVPLVHRQCLPPGFPTSRELREDPGEPRSPPPFPRAAKESGRTHRAHPQRRGQPLARHSNSLLLSKSCLPSLPSLLPGGRGGEDAAHGVPMASPKKGFYRQELTKTLWEVKERYRDLQPVGSGAYGSVW